MQARTEEYARLLRRFSASELEEAYRDVLQTWDSPAWPPPGRFFTAAAENRKMNPDCPHQDSLREAAAIQYVQDGTVPPPGLRLPLKTLLSRRVAALESAGLPKGVRSEISEAEARAIAEQTLAAQAAGKAH